MKRDFQAVAWQQVGDAVGPFDEGEAGGVEVFFGAEREELIIVLEAVGVEVEDRQAALAVFVHEHERRAGDGVARDAEGGGDGLDESRLAGAEGADERDDRAGRQDFG